MTPEEYAAQSLSIKADVVAVITAAAPLALVLDRDPVNFDLDEWYGALKSDNDLDENGEKRVHAYTVTFAASDDLDSSTTRSIAPTIRLRVQSWYSHDFGTTADNSERRNAAEVMRVQYALATMEKPANVQGRALLPMRVRLADLAKHVVHKGEGEIAFELAPIRTH